MPLSMGIETLIHLVLTTSPFLLLFSYFIYSASQRPNLPIYHLYEINDDAVRQQMIQSNDTVIKLSGMLYSFLLTFILWSILTVYLAFFIAKRRRLMERYQQEGVVSVLGNVLYDRPSGICANLRGKCHNEDYAYVTYQYPSDNNNVYNNHTKTEDEEAPKLVVEKVVRTYFPYHREKITILILPNLPLSGQPKEDIERDVSTYQSNYAIKNRNRKKYVLVLCISWIFFCLFGALYILHQMSIMNEMNFDNAEEEDLDTAWIIFWIVLLLVTPILAFGGNLIQWWWYYKWITDRGCVTAHVSKDVPQIVQSEDYYNEDEEVICSMNCNDRVKRGT